MSKHTIKKILFSQNPPTDFDKSPYADIAKKYNVKIDFHKFFQITGLPAVDFRKSKIYVQDYSAIIFTNKYAIDHFFRILSELRIDKLPKDTKFFCINASTRHYLQKYTICRKRRAFFPKSGEPDKLVEEMSNHPTEKFLFPSALDSSNNQLIGLLDKAKIDYTKAEVFTTSFADVSQVINLYEYDMVVFFSPYGIQALQHSYPDFKQENMIVGALGSRVVAAAQEMGLTVQITAPTQEHLSIFSAVEHYLRKFGIKR